MAKKTTKRQWKIKQTGKQIEAEFTPVENLNQAAPQVWFTNPQQPGLHLMRSLRGDNVCYDTVRVIFTDNGVEQCNIISTPNETHRYYMTEFTSPAFQKVQE